MELRNNKLAAYSAFAVSFITLSTKADAQVIYTDIDPDLMLDEAGDKLGVDLDQDGVNDIVFQKNLIDVSFPYVISSNTYQIYYGIDFMRAKISGEHSLAATYSSLGYYALPFALSAGDEVGPDLNWYDASQQFMQRSVLLRVSTESGFSFSSTFGSGYFIPGNSNLYLGVKMKLDKNIFYGWVRFDVTSESHFVIKDHALNLTSNASIEAGDMGEPLATQSLNENTVQAYSFDQTIYVILQSGQQQVDAKLYNMNGSLVHAQVIGGGKTAIALPQQPTGVYTLQLTAPDGFYSKTLNLY
jgi:hypothetical protein